jgi:hypothetical protein
MMMIAAGGCRLTMPRLFTAAVLLLLLLCAVLLLLLLLQIRQEVLMLLLLHIMLPYLPYHRTLLLLLLLLGWRLVWCQSSGEAHGCQCCWRFGAEQVKAAAVQLESRHHPGPRAVADACAERHIINRA